MNTSTQNPGYPMRRTGTCPFDPAPGLRELQRDEPLAKVTLWDGTTAWAVTRYDDQRALLAHPRISSDASRPGYPHISAATRQVVTTTPGIGQMDDPEHARLRRMLTGTFTVRRIERLRPAVQRIVDGLIDEMLAGPAPADLVNAFALAVPSLVICELLGVPYADHEFFQRNSKIIVRRDRTPEDTVHAQRALLDYLGALIAEKTADPADDLLSALAVEQVATGAMSTEQLATIGMMLLVAGHETTTNMISLGTLALLRDPDQLALLKAAEEPGEIATAVEELLRYLSVVQAGLRRIARNDFELAGQIIRAGEAIVVPTELGNRDQRRFPDPDRLDLERDVRGHLAFGFGVHQCLGQSLARLELQVTYTTLFRRIPTLRLAVDPADLSFAHEQFIYGPHELPVAW
ncbi:cytochrome P450 [Nonomuraea sp. B19D2]|uniref:cytochrome P450 n=1 Tax=Nonomuraea sp. B19D2 TaxID=3159561 RepID=UPI0032D9C772